jgi:hypothetical protein
VSGPAPNPSARPAAALSPPARAVGALLALALIAGYSLALLIPVYANTGASDFAVFYYPAAQLFVQAANPYSVSFYVQPPALLFLFAPFTLLAPEAARAAWLGVESVLLLGGIAATLRALDFRMTDLRLGLLLLVFLSPNVIWGLMIGQSVVVIFFLQAVGLWLLRSGRPFWGGLALGAVVLKPHLLAVELPVLLSAPRRAWAGAAVSIGALLLGPELLGVHLLEPFLRKLLPEVREERYNKLNLADMFVNLGGGPEWLRALGWLVLGIMGLVYVALLWRIWRGRGAPAAGRWQLTPLAQLAMVVAYLWLPYTLAYDLILVAGSYLWRFQANGYRLDRALTWNLGLLWLLPILTLLLHALGVPTTLNPLLMIGLVLLLLRPAGAPVAQTAAPPVAPLPS